MGGGGGVAEPSKVVNGAWWTFASTLMMLMTAGTIYGFSNWSEVFRDPAVAGYELDGTHIELMGTFSHAGNYIVLEAGWLNKRFGTHFTFGYGCAWACSGYTLLWMSAQWWPGQVPFPLLCIFCMMYGHGCGSIDNAALTELIADFPKHRGNLVGCLKAYYGLASAIVAVIYYAVFAPDQKGFLIFLAIYSGVSGLILVPVIKRCKGLVAEPKQQTSRKFNMVAAGIVVYIIFILLVNLFKPTIQESENSQAIFLGILTIVVIGIASFFILPLCGGTTEAGQSLSIVGTELAVTFDRPDPDTLHSTPEPDGVQALPNLTVCEMIRSPQFLVLFVVCVVGQGSGLLFINNASQLSAAYSGTNNSSAVTTLVSLISCFNSFGRLIYGNLSEAMLPRFSRIWFLLLSLSLLCFSYWLLFFFGKPVLSIVGAIVGFAYGGLWGVQPVIIVEVFGPADYGMKYAVSAIAAFAGSIIFPTLIAGTLYDREAERLHSDPNCWQPSCFSQINLITGCLSLLGCLLTLGVHALTKGVYAAHRERLRLVPNA